MINSSLWLLLIALATFLGWYLGYQARLSKNAKIFRFPRNYLLGLNYLLNEQPDKAVDIFIKMLDVDSDTVETHLALGNLFRRRGELNRAILIHQNLVNKSDLEHEQRVLALSELGQDYLSAGVLDRAEGVFKQVIRIDDHPLVSLTALLDIYQQEKNWEAAITVAKQIELVSGKRMHKMIAHYYCHLAENYHQQAENKAALREANQALSVDKNCVRANLLLATIEREQGEFKQALKTVKRIALQSPDLLTEALPIMIDCYRTLADEEGLLSALTTYAQEYPHYPFIRELTTYLRQWKGDKAAYDAVVTFLQRSPSFHGLKLLVELRLAMAEKNAGSDDLLSLQDLLQRLLINQSPYRCQQCGFSSKTLHWQCPSCKNWETMKYQKAS